jgi:two-component system nitrate/nitrite response regulator NarL
MIAATTNPVKILIVDDHPTLRKGLMQLINLEDDLRVIGEAGNGEEALERAKTLKPDLILLDLNLPVMNGFEILQGLRDAKCNSRIVVFSVSEEQGDIAKALRLGADGYLLKDMEPEELIDSLRESASGKLVVSSKLNEAMARALRQQDELPNSYSSLTQREKQVLECLSEGLSNKMIGRKMSIAEGTVKVHVKRLLQKLGMRSRVEAAVWFTSEMNS